MNRDCESAEKDCGLDLAAYLVLLALTVLTVAVSRVSHGRILGVTLALCVAGAKASVIGFHFMGLRKEGATAWTCLLVACAAVLVLLLGILPDVGVWVG